MRRTRQRSIEERHDGVVNHTQSIRVSELGGRICEKERRGEKWGRSISKSQKSTAGSAACLRREAFNFNSQHDFVQGFMKGKAWTRVRMLHVLQTPFVLLLMSISAELQQFLGPPPSGHTWTEAQLESLTFLRRNNGAIASVPPCVSLLTALEELHVVGNNLT